MSQIVTIGVYGFTLDAFLAALSGAGVNCVIDVRQRRGVRGAEYAWANAQRLQRALADVGLGYEHHRELAPTTALRQLQYAEDERRGVGKRSREQIGDEFRAGYVREVLDAVDLDELVAALSRWPRPALMCVEADPEACHRSIVAERLAREHGLRVTHLQPPITRS